MTTTIAVIDLQLLLLVLMVLFGIAGRTAAGRDQDLALADLRGLSPGSLWAVALREPFVLMIAATPSGPRSAGWSPSLSREQSCSAESPSRSIPWPRGRALAASLAALVATAAGSAPRPQTPTGRTASRRARALGTALARLAAEAFVVALALAAVVQLSASGVGTHGAIAAARRPRPRADRPCRWRDRRPGCPLRLPVARRGRPVLAKGGPFPRLQRVARQSGDHPPVGDNRDCGRAWPASLSPASGSTGPTARIESAFLVGANRVLTVSAAGERRLRTGGAAGRSVRPSRDGSAGGVELAGDLARRRRFPLRERRRLGAISREPRRRQRRRALPRSAGGARRHRSRSRASGSSIDLSSAGEPEAVARGERLQRAVRCLRVGHDRTASCTARHDYSTSLQGDCVSVCRLKSIAVSWPGSPQRALRRLQSTTIPVEIEQIDEQAGARFAPVAAGLSRPGAVAGHSGPAGQRLVVCQPRPRARRRRFKDVVGQAATRDRTGGRARAASCRGDRTCRLACQRAAARPAPPSTRSSISTAAPSP